METPILIPLRNPTTPEQREFDKLLVLAKEKHHATFQRTIVSDGFVTCEGKLLKNDLVLWQHSTSLPIGNNVGYARVMAEILCLVTCLEALGDVFEWQKADEPTKIIEVNPKTYQLDKDYLMGSSSLKDCLRRVQDSGYPNYDALVIAIDEIKNTQENGKRLRATKSDVVDFIFNKVGSPAIAPTRTNVKPVRSGIEWSNVKRMAMRLKELPTGYKDAEDFANFATKLEVDGVLIQLESHKHTKQD